MRLQIIILVLVILPSAGHAYELNELVDGYFRATDIDISFSFHELGFEVKDSNNNQLGKLAGGMLPTFLVNFETPGYYLGTSNVGWNLIAGLSTYCVNTQKLGNGKVVNLNTSASGLSAYVTPALFYTWGDKRYQENDYHAFRTGLGLGLGYLSATGSLVLTETPAQNTLSVDTSGFGISSTLFIEYRQNRWIYRLRSMGPSFSRGDYNYTVYDIYFGVGYLVNM